MGLVEFLRHKGSLKLSKNSRTISITVGAQFRATLRGGNSGKFSRIPPISSLVATAIKAYRWHKRIFPVFISDIYSFDCAKWGKMLFERNYSIYLRSAHQSGWENLSFIMIDGWMVQPRRCWAWIPWRCRCNNVGVLVMRKAFRVNIDCCLGVSTARPISIALLKFYCS